MSWTHALICGHDRAIWTLLRTLWRRGVHLPPVTIAVEAMQCPISSIVESRN